MSCLDFRLWLSVYIDGMLEGEREYKLKAHLDSCPDCMKEYGYFVSLNKCFIKDEITPSPYFRMKFWQKAGIDSEKREKKRNFFLLLPAYLTAAVILTLFFFSASVIQAYRKTTEDESINAKIVKAYLKKTVLCVSFTPVSCWEFLSDCAAECRCGAEMKCYGSLK